jgi:purine-nucleoside phosphorylase
MMETIRRAAAQVKGDRAPTIGLILGSGWNLVIDSVQNPVHVPYAQVPGMKTSTVPGHAGEWVLGDIGAKSVAIMSGRLHYYEGYALSDIVFPVRMMKAMGVETLIVTNAAGAINTSYECGDLMLIADHICLTANSPLFGPNIDELGPRFPDMSAAYDKELRALAKCAAADLHFAVREGVYAQMTGPSFETPAEIRMLRTLGADAVGMSTVPEVVAARHAGLRVLGLSCMTNMAAGVLDQPLSHAEVLETANRMKGRFKAYLEAVVAGM